MVLKECSLTYKQTNLKILDISDRSRPVVSIVGKGLTVCVTVIRGDFAKSSGEAQVAKQALRKIMDDEKVKGFADVLIAKDPVEGISHL